MDMIILQSLLTGVFVLLCLGNIYALKGSSSWKEYSSPIKTKITLWNCILFTIVALGFFISCEKNNAINNNETNIYENDTLSNPYVNNDSDYIIGTWEISNFVYYSNDKEIQIVDIISPSNNGKSLCFEEIAGSNDLLLTLKYANILSTYCKVEQGNSITISNEWGGTELFDCSGNEEKIINLLNSVDFWEFANGNLYLINSKLSSNYNALCLKK